MLTHFAGLESELHIANPCSSSRFTGLSSLQMQRDFFQNILWTKFYNKLKSKLYRFFFLIININI
jgi:hypothetical protein